MNNLPPRLIFFAIGILIVVVMIINHGLGKELAVPSKPVTVFAPEETPAPEPMRIEEKDYNPHSNYAPSPPKAGLREEVFGVKKPERVLDTKIIYEMPTSNKILLE